MRSRDLDYLMEYLTGRRVLGLRFVLGSVSGVA